jgi:predicted nucleic acid-binding protein
MRLYLDANPIIYSVEGVPGFRLATLAWIERAEVAQGVVITSRLSRLECRVKPLREGDAELLERFEGFFSREGLELVEVNAEVIEQATAPRAKHNFRAPDAIQLASAIVVKADVFLTRRPEPRAMPGPHGRGAWRHGRLVKE